ncbi:type VII secretion integral membrane protein EccD [Glycomyces algeriensis]|uniref:Type VII secretion integral membrane protein EccD n=1 Tax=Glycomyces algeriensis TaxID=256037 RepID=A0A9W6G3H0_9ACTN|nr:type VII secretion integral membrane protein EccD [Glycomyces algeriensis]MDA1366983.1 type VII secretion integral membrane protein EccD [Glycomyces algeriensis]MDR7352630.1 type VII secretion integral membrane protein EccD [Glycomyces algeriensis]GLI40310.1 type VII secretion integral membrane protein EccD [Glycomyces algeriensis]
MSTKSATLSRVTIVSPRTRIDLALPSDVPLSDLLPTILHQAGEYYIDEAGDNGGWILTRLGEEAIDTGHSCSQLGINDGEMLYLNPADAAKPEVVFDDIIDAIATATEQRGNRWDYLATKRFSVGIGTAALAVGATALLLTLHLASAIVALAVAVILVGASALLSRAVGDSRAATYFGITSVLYGGVGGLLIADQEHTGLFDLDGQHVIIAASAILLFSVLAMVAVGDMASAPVFIVTILGAVVLGVSTALMLIIPNGTAATAAGIAAPLALAILPFAPSLSLTMAMVPTPQLPTTTEELKEGDAEAIDGKRILKLSEHAGNYLEALYSFAAVVGLIASIALAFSGELPGLILSTILSLVLLSRSRTIEDRAARIVMLTGGMGGLAATLAAIFVASEDNILVRLTVILGALTLLTLIAMVYGLAVAGKKIAPTWGRALDIIEALLIVAILPLVGWVCDLYTIALSLRG